MDSRGSYASRASSGPRRGALSSPLSRSRDRLSSPRPSTQVHESDVAFRRPQEACEQVPLSGDVQDKEVRGVPDADSKIRRPAQTLCPMEGHGENLARAESPAESRHLVR